MYTPTQLEAIRIFGKKDLSFGCLYNYDGRKGIFKVNGESIISSLDKSKVKILGHEPHLEDVFRVAKEKKFHYIDLTHLSDGTHELCFAWTGETDDECIPYNPTLQLLEQSESTLQQIISLFE